MLILHGIWESGRTFAGLAAALSGSRPVYCLDLRGHGDSDRPARGYRFADYAEDVLALLPRLGERVDLLGHSLGANVVLYVASAGHPAIGRSVVIDPPILLAGDWPAVRADLRRDRELARRPAGEIVSELSARMGTGDDWPAIMAAALARTADGVFAAMVDGEQRPVDWPGLLSRIGTPVLAVAPDPGRTGTLLRGPRLDTFRRGVPHAEVQVVPGAGHHVERDQPELLTTIVRNYLRRSREAM